MGSYKIESKMNYHQKCLNFWKGIHAYSRN